MKPLRALALMNVACLFCAVSARLACADAVADFYRGKTITLVSGSGPGGVYDIGARWMARHLGQFIPGDPNVIVQNMPGASSVLAAGYLYNVAAPDGTVIGDIQPTIVLDKALDQSLRYAPEKFLWLGRLRQNTVFGYVWHSAPAITVAQAINHQDIFAANSASGYAAMLPWALNRMVGTKIKVVTGYESETAEWLAVERNEANGIGSGALSDVPGRDWLSKGLVEIMYSNGMARSAVAPDAPTLNELAKDEQDREAMALLSTSSEIGETLLAPPATPADRIAALRRAFARMMSDRAFLADASQSQIDLDFLAGDKMQSIVVNDSRTPASIIERIKQLTRPEN